ncbi:hypothetical protein [Microbacterium sp.]|uniref:hypothetical protein n=1 Tax=Microbacterium sp. TaxID=51671 RepID=UPI0025DFE55A|nr:hypothetical protein [Microbacterium sp.]MBT9605743.1 hypothetical protein [Microbacterium sp.]
MTQVDQPIQAALGDALGRVSWADTVGGVKQVITHYLEGLHSGATIRHTDFFNHSFAPDITMEWRDGSNPERRVFLRFPDHPDFIADSVERDLPTGSMVVGLGELEGRDEAPVLAEASKDRNTLVVDSSGLDTLSRSASEGSGESVVTSAVAKGARGLFGRAKSAEVTSRISSGLQGASRGEASATGDAAQTSQEDFDPRQAKSLEYLLQTYWIAGGARPDEYPGQFQPGVRIGANELSLLLDTLDIDDWAFWRNLGNDVSLDRIFALGASTNSANLSRLIRANVDRFTAKAAWIRPGDGRLREPDEPDFDWRLENDLLRLVGPTFDAHFAEKRKRITKLSADHKQDGIAPSVLLERAPTLGITEVRFDDGRSQLVFATDDITADDRTVSMAESFGDAGRIVRATATVPTAGTHATVDFELSTVVAVTNSNPPLDGLVRTAIQALVPLDEGSSAAFEEFIALPAEIAADGVIEPSIFDSVLEGDEPGGEASTDKSAIGPEKGAMEPDADEGLA